MFIDDIKKNLMSNSLNTIEFYGTGLKILKKHTEIYRDVQIVLEYFRKNNIGEKDRIGILSSNIYEWIPIDLACLLGGFILVTFHEKDFEKDINSLHEQYNLKVLFIDEKRKQSIDSHSNNLFIVCQEILKDDINKNFINDEYRDKKVAHDEEDNFTILFTSGTTGVPKALEMRKKCADDFLNMIKNEYQINNNDKCVIFLPLSVFSSRIFVYSAIIYKCNAIVTTPDLIVAALRIYQPTILQSVPLFFESIHKMFYLKIRSSFMKNIIFNIYVFLKKYIPLLITEKIQKILFKEIISFWGSKMRFMITGSAHISYETLKFYHIIGIPLYEVYGTNEVGMIAINTPKANRPGSVGKPVKNKEVILDNEKQILVKSEFSQVGYLDKTEEINYSVFRSDGFIATGDIGYFDKDGYLYLKGRIKEIITLTNGQKINPSIIEKKIEYYSYYIKQCMLYGDDKPYLTAVIVRTNENISSKEIQNVIKEFNRNLPDYQQIKDFIIISETFNMENNLLTNNMKLNRNEISRKYKNRIEELYACN